MSNDMSHGIARGTAYEMQSEAELQLRHQIRDTVRALAASKKSVSTVRDHITNMKKEMFMQSAANGMKGARDARRRIRERS